MATPDALSDAVSARLTAKEGFALATLNLDHLVKLHRDDAFSIAYQSQDFIVADGNPVVWMSRLAKKPVALMPGSDLVVPLAKIAARLDVPIALVGSTDDALSGAAQALQTLVPELQVVSQIAPKMGFDPNSSDADAALAEVVRSGAGLAFLALGAPKQEILAARGRTSAPNVGFASIGAGLDFLTGHQRRAPRWMQILALEWLWRLISSPLRLARRYLRCIGILPRLFVDALRLRRAG